MLLTIYLFGVVFAFVGYVIYLLVRDRKSIHWPSDLFIACLVSGLSWITVILSIQSIWLSLRNRKREKEEARRIAEIGRLPKRSKEYGTPMKVENKWEMLKPIESSELKKSMKSFSEN